MNTKDQDDTGVVFRKSLGHYTVHVNGRELDCVLSSLLHKQLIYPTADPTSLRRRVVDVREIEHADPIAIGDRVRFTDAGGDRGMITEILPRASKLSRPAAVPGRGTFEQIIVSNADLVVPVFAAASPAPKWGLLDRYLVTVEAAELPVLIVVTKLDLVQDSFSHREHREDESFSKVSEGSVAGQRIGNHKLDAELDVYRRIGYPIHRVSSHTGKGIEGLKEILRGKTSVLIGKSGVGKTSLLNAIQPGLGLRVKEVGKGELGKGRHTTTHLEMFTLDFGGRLVDTPGMREFGLWNISADELAHFFPEMTDLVGGCKFGLSCRHDSEPGCAIRKAVMDGWISPHRYKSYMKLRSEL
jgi:ribosome biogenesis GTPase / thiamine phosphate phosphatase